MPKLTIDAMVIHFFNVRARARARAFGIRSGDLGFGPRATPGGLGAMNWALRAAPTGCWVVRGVKYLPS
ncbi:MAG: hypothetical protein E6J21_11435 [Chloroflexota bacterium]|nr:MAG: hypothetical protein E6J21_11435 [Chloroflexota bacterium]